MNITRSTDAPGGFAAKCIHFPAFGLSFIRLSIPARTSTVYKDGQTYDIASIPDGYRPNSSTPFSSYNTSGATADIAVNSAGEIKMYVRGGDIPTYKIINAAGCWFI